MKRWLKVFWPIGMASGVLLLIAAGAWSVRGTAQADTAVMKVAPASQTVDVSDGEFTVDIVVENVDNLAAFEFTLTFDPSILGLVGVEKGPFLGSTGRQVFCTQYIHYSPAPSVPTEDAVVFGCVTGAPGAKDQKPGASGTGVVATVTFVPCKAGTSQLRMGLTNDQFHLADPFSEDVPVSAEGGSVKVTGSGGCAAPDPDDPTRVRPQTPAPRITPVATPPNLSYLTPEAGEPVLVRPIDSADTLAARSNGGTDGESAASGGAGGSPRAGEGPPEKEAPWWPVLVSGLLAVGGTALLSLAAYARRAVNRRQISE